MTQLQLILNDLRVSQGEMSRATGLAKSSVNRLVKRGIWPAKAKADVPQRLAAFLRQRGAQPRHWAALRDAGVFAVESLFGGSATTKQEGPAELRTRRGPVVPATPTASEQLEDSMLLEFANLTEQAKKAFGLARNPFIDEISCREDVFQTPSTRLVRASLMDAAVHHGFIAVIGESGSGKSTLREELEQRISDEGRNVIVIKPYTLAMEKDDVKGKRMKSGQIAEAIARALAPSVQLRSSPEARFDQVHGLLRESCRAGSRHLLIIEEAHRMPLTTLRHLKGWMELKDGLRRLLGVCLIGQSELGELLSETRRDIREIVQRCEKVYMPPLDNDLESYLAHKLNRVGAKASDVFDGDAYDALRARLVYVPRGGKAQDAESTCYPLAVNNLVVRAMNAAARAGWPKVDAGAVAGC